MELLEIAKEVKDPLPVADVIDLAAACAIGIPKVLTSAIDIPEVLSVVLSQMPSEVAE